MKLPPKNIFFHSCLVLILFNPSSLFAMDPLETEEIVGVIKTYLNIDQKGILVKTPEEVTRGGSEIDQPAFSSSNSKITTFSSTQNSGLETVNSCQDPITSANISNMIDHSLPLQENEKRISDASMSETSAESLESGSVDSDHLGELSGVAVERVPSGTALDASKTVVDLAFPSVDHSSLGHHISEIHSTEKESSAVANQGKITSTAEIINITSRAASTVRALSIKVRDDEKKIRMSDKREEALQKALLWRNAYKEMLPEAMATLEAVKTLSLEEPLEITRNIMTSAANVIILTTRAAGQSIPWEKFESISASRAEVERQSQVTGKSQSTINREHMIVYEIYRVIGNATSDIGEASMALSDPEMKKAFAMSRFSRVEHQVTTEKFLAYINKRDYSKRHNFVANMGSGSIAGRVAGKAIANDPSFDDAMVLKKAAEVNILEALDYALTLADRVVTLNENNELY